MAMQANDVIRRCRLQMGDSVGIPGRMHDAQVGALQYQRLCVEEGDKRGFPCGGIALPWRIDAGIARGATVKKPAAAVFGVVKQQVNFVVAEYGLHPAPRVQAPVPVQHGGDVRAAIHQVAEEDEIAPLRVRAILVVAEMT